MLHRPVLGMTLATMLVATSLFAREVVLGRSEFGWALASKGTTVATSVEELSRLDEWLLGGERVLFARFGEEGYLIRDRATLDRVDQLVEPIRKLSEKARQIAAPADRRDKLARREWKERLRPYKEKRRVMLLGITGEIEALARAAVRRGEAQRVN